MSHTTFINSASKVSCDKHNASPYKAVNTAVILLSFLLLKSEHAALYWLGIMRTGALGKKSRSLLKDPSRVPIHR